MRLPTDHRKLVKHFDEQGQGHELTFSCYQRLPLLNDDHRCEQLATAIDRAVHRHGFSLLAYVFMPEHVHLIVLAETSTAGISDLLFAIKRPVSYRIKQDLIASGNPLLKKLTIRERPGKTSFRFWQEGPGYDRNIHDEKTLEKMIDYVHLNPVRRELVDHPSDWKWSSWRQYEGGVQSGFGCTKGQHLDVKLSERSHWRASRQWHPAMNRLPVHRLARSLCGYRQYLW